MQSPTTQQQEPMPSTHDAMTVATLPANAARLAAEELLQSVRQAKDNGEPQLAALLEQAMYALHHAGWNEVL